MTTFKSVLVTGAGRGIGLELVRQLLQDSTRVVRATVRSSSPDLLELQKQVSDHRLFIEQLDVTSDESIDQLVEKLNKENVKLDLLINNAGVGERNDPITSSTREKILSVFDTNTLAPLFVSQKFYNAQLLNPSSLIVNISSIIGSIENMNQYTAQYSSYAISKSALNMVTKLQSVSFDKVRAVSIHPGWLKTRMGGEQAPLDVSEGVSGIVNIIDNFKQEQNGSYLQFNGEPLKW